MGYIDLLKQLSFGAQVAEDEVAELANYFVETNDWAKIENGEIDIVRGEKGAGKSAIYSLLLTRESMFFDKGILLVAAENPRGATVFKDLVADPPTSENEFIALWKLYALTIIAQQLRDYEIKGSKVDQVFRALEDAKLLETEFSLKSVLRAAHEYAKRLIAWEAIEGDVKLDPATQMPSGLTGRIILREPDSELKAKGIISVDSLFEIVNVVLKENNIKVWVLLDRLDVAFIENHELEANALRALIRAYADIRSRENISLKIFLREDIWRRITEKGFREASHLIRYVILDWTEPAILNLIVRRLLNNDSLVQELRIDKEKIFRDSKAQENLFSRIFPEQVEQGPQKASTFKWIVTRCADGTGKTAPREIIHLLKCVLAQEIRRLEQGGAAASNNKLFDRAVFKLALPEVSGARLNQYLYAEYPDLKIFVEKLEGQKAEQSPDSLAKLWNLKKSDAIAKARELVALGFFEERGSKGDPMFWVPFLYRDGLYLIQGKAD